MFACSLLQALAAFPVKGVALPAAPVLPVAPDPDAIVTALRRLAVGTLLAAVAGKPAHTLYVHTMSHASSLRARYDWRCPLCACAYAWVWVWVWAWAWAWANVHVPSPN